MSEPENIVRPQFRSIDGGKDQSQDKLKPACVFDINRVIDPAEFDTIKLPDPQYGEEVIGSLSEDDCKAFVLMHQADVEMHRLDREIGGALMEVAGQKIKTGEFDPRQANTMADLAQVDEVKAIEFCRLLAFTSQVKAAFWWTVGERFNAHDYRLSVRSKRRVVKLMRRFQ